MVSRMLYITLIYFKCWGFGCELPKSSSSKGSRQFTCNVALAIAVYHLCCLVCNAITVIHFNSSIFYSRELLGMVNDAIKYCCSVLAYGSIVIESYFKRHALRKFWCLFNDIDTHYKRQADLSYRRYFIVFIAFFLMTIALEVNLLQRIVYNQQSFQFWCLFLGLLIMGRTRMLQYVLFVEIIRQQVAVLKTQLESVGKLHRDEGLCVKRLRWTQNYYRLIYEMSEAMNEFFGWSQFTVILQSFTILVVDFNWTYWRIYNEYTRELAG